MSERADCSESTPSRDAADVPVSSSVLAKRSDGGNGAMAQDACRTGSPFLARGHSPSPDVYANPMSGTEGVTKFRLDFRPGAAAPGSLILSLNAWRTVLHRLGLIGQDPARYGGLGFGNVSVRAADGTHAFWISGTQTGHLPALNASHYCCVVDCDLRDNSLLARGSIPPSSESLTHAALYQRVPDILCVLHVHSPEIWRHANDLRIPIIDHRIAYGTPEMADAVGRLAATTCGEGILAMAGHLDGIVAFGPHIEHTAAALINCLARAIQQESTKAAAHDPAV